MNTLEGKCVKKGAKTDCAQITTGEADCKSDKTCMFYTDIGKCWETGKQVPCSEYADAGQELCPDYCKWEPTGSPDGGAAGVCVDVDQEVGDSK
jgi:hypothetical protein